MIVMVEGATRLVTPEYVNEVAEGLIERSKVVVCQLENPIASTLAALRIASQKGAKTIFNAAPAHQVPNEILALTEILCVNELEVRENFRFTH